METSKNGPYDTIMTHDKNGILGYPIFRAKHRETNKHLVKFPESVETGKKTCLFFSRSCMLKRMLKWSRSLITKMIDEPSREKKECKKWPPVCNRWTVGRGKQAFEGGGEMKIELFHQNFFFALFSFRHNIYIYNTPSILYITYVYISSIEGITWCFYPVSLTIFTCQVSTAAAASVGRAPGEVGGSWGSPGSRVAKMISDDFWWWEYLYPPIETIIR